MDWMCYIEFNLQNGVITRFPLIIGETLHLDIPEDTTIHRIRNLEHLFNPVPGKKTKVFTASKDEIFRMWSKSYAFVLKGKSTADGIVEAVIFGAFLPESHESLLYDWGVENPAQLKKNFESLA